MLPFLFACQALRAAGSVRAMGRGKLTIRAARVAGVEIPNQKRLETALTCACVPLLAFSSAKLTHSRSYIYGIGPTTAKAILVETVRCRGCTECAPCADSSSARQKIENKRTRELSEEELTVLRDEVSKYQVEGDLVRPVLVC